MELDVPILLNVRLDIASAFIGALTDTAFTETIPFGRALVTLADEDGVQQPFDLAGWQFRYQIGTAVQYTDGASPVPSVVIANADVNAFTISNTNQLDWTVDCNTDEFLEAITDPAINRFVTARGELWGRPSSSDPWQLSAKWDLRAAGSVFDVTQTPTSTADTYYTAPQIDAMLAALIGAGITFQRNGDTATLCIDGVPVQDWTKPS